MSEAAVRPAVVGYAVKMLYAILAFGILRAGLEFQALIQKAPASFVVAVWAAVFGLFLFLVYKIGARRNWARITYLIFFLLGFPSALTSFFKPSFVTSLTGAVGILQMLGQVAALVMLFLPEANAWFRRPKVVGGESDQKSRMTTVPEKLETDL